MEAQIKPLVITPLPIVSESLMGLLLRTSEANGYKRLSYILQYAGLTENELRSIRPPLRKVAQLFGKEATHLSKFYPDQAKDNKKKRWTINGYIIPSLYINIKSANICPECVLEVGYINHLWDLKFVRICTKHQRELIDSCPSCKKPLTWHRQGLLTCCCGQDLSETRGRKVTDKSLLSMSALIEWKLANHHYDDKELVRAGYPLTALKSVSLSTLLGIVERLQKKRKRKTNFPQPFGNNSKLNILKVAYDMFERWPHGFYDLLENLSPENRHIASRNLQAQYRYVYNSFFKSGLPENEMQFIRKAFVTFANERLGEDVYIDSRLAKHAATSRRYVGIKGVAEHLMVKEPTIRNFVKKGLLKPELRESMGKTRQVFDLQNLPFRAKEGNYLRLRVAAKYLHLSERLLTALKKAEIYKIKRLGWGADGFSELDLIEFKTELIEKAPKTIEAHLSSQISLRELFRKKRNHELSIKVIDEMLKGSLIPVGRLGEEAVDIVFKKKDIKLRKT